MPKGSSRCKEVAQGLHDKGAKKASGHEKKVAARQPQYSEAPQLVLDLGEPKQDDALVVTTIIDFRQAAQQRTTKQAAEEQAIYASTASV